MNGFLFNPDYYQLLCPVLDQVKQLHSEYKNGVQTLASDKAFRDVRGLLSHPELTPALDDLLRGTQLDIALLYGRRTVEQREIDAEVRLGELFGFKPKQVRSYIEGTRATTPGDVETSAAGLRSSDDLLMLVNLLHGYLRRLQANPPSGFFEVRQHKRKLKKDIDATIFFIGVIAADALQTAYFRLSYTVALTTFVRLVPNE